MHADLVHTLGLAYVVECLVGCDYWIPAFAGMTRSTDIFTTCSSDIFIQIS